MKFQITLFSIIMLTVFLSGCDGKNGEAVEDADALADNKNDLVTDEWDAERRNEFANTAANINMTEIRAGEIAQNKAQLQRIKEYGQTLVEDHRESYQQLKDMAPELNITVPDTIDQEYQQKVREVENFSESEFRTQFLDMMIKEHENAITTFEEANRNIIDERFDTWIDNTIISMRKHLKMARAIKEDQNEE